MHLIDLIATLEAVKVARGNIKLVDVLVHAEGDKESLADHSDRRTKAPAPELVIDITGMSSDQVEELQAENPTARFIRRTCSTEGCLRPPDHAEDHLFKKCNRVSTTRGACTLDIGHAGDHAWELPVQLPDPLEPTKSENIDGPAASETTEAPAADSAAQSEPDPAQAETLQE
jgi:hypothetical protein